MLTWQVNPMCEEQCLSSTPSLWSATRSKMHLSYLVFLAVVIVVAVAAAAAAVVGRVQ